MGSQTLFFYGTLMAPPVLYRVIYGTSSPNKLEHPAMAFLKIRPALLKGYRRHRVAHCDYPAIVAEEGGEVRGNVVEGLTEGDVWRLTIFEGDQYELGSAEVEVLEGVGLGDAAAAAEGGNNDEAGGGGDEKKGREVVQAQTYVWKEDKVWLESEEWDFEDFKKRKMSRWAGLDDDGTNGWGEVEEQDEKVQEDEGFADVDRAVEEVQEQQKRGKQAGINGYDPMGGRSFNGDIGKQLEETRWSEPESESATNIRW